MAKPRQVSIFLSLLLAVQLSAAYAADSYRFERMWPTLQQPWYFNQPMDVAVDDSGFVYVADLLNSRIVKLNSNGQVIGSQTVSNPNGLYIDENGIIYVARFHNEIWKLNSNLELIGSIKLGGTAENTVVNAARLVIANEKIYVTDGSNHFVTVFSMDGVQEDFWEIEGASGAGVVPGWERFPIEADSKGNIVVSDTSNAVLHIFTPDGDVISTLDILELLDIGNSEYSSSLGGIAIDSEDNIYMCTSSGIVVINSQIELERSFYASNTSNDVLDCLVTANSLEIQEKNDSVTLFATMLRGILVNSGDGEFINYWGARGENSQQLVGPVDIAIDDNGVVYIADNWAGAINKSNLSGGFIESINVSSDSIGYPNNILFRNGSIYLLTYGGDTSHIDRATWRVTRYSNDGNPLSTIDIFDPALYTSVFDFDIDEDGSIYVSVTKTTFDESGPVPNSEERGIIKLSPTGDLLATNFPIENMTGGVLLDQDENLILTYLHGFSILNKNLELESIVEVDDLSCDSRNIALSSSGDFLFGCGTSVGIVNLQGELLDLVGKQGIAPGNHSEIRAVASDSLNNIYSVDWGATRIQKFRKASVSDNSKAIVVAAGGPFPGNNLWDTTQLSASFAYRALTYQGFTKDSIYYLSSDTDLDLDQNGVADDVDADADATIANLEYAIKEWASDADNLTIYLVDHGGVNTFRMSANEVLSADAVASWVNELQTTMPGRVTFVYDACESGTFMSTLQAPPGIERTIITSTPCWITTVTVLVMGLIWPPCLLSLSVTVPIYSLPLLSCSRSLPISLLPAPVPPPLTQKVSPMWMGYPECGPSPVHQITSRVCPVIQ